MNNQEEITTPWTIWHLLARLNDFIWDRYENEFIERYLELEEEKYWEGQSNKDPPWDSAGSYNLSYRPNYLLHRHKRL